MSRVLPNAMVGQAFRRLGVSNDFLEADLPPMVSLGLQKLYGFQHNDGGWGWWYDDSTDVNQTAYVLLGLVMTGQAGFEVDGSVVERGIAALERMLPEADPRDQAYGAYVMAMAGQPLTVTLTLSQALELDTFSQAALAIALDGAGDGTLSAALLDNLRESAVQDGSAVYWPDEEGDPAYSRKVMGSTVRTTAMAVDALARLDPESPLLPGATRWLMAQRQGQGWGDTQKTSFAILALTDYWLASGEQAAGTAYRLYLNRQLGAQGQLAQADAGATWAITHGTTISPALLLPGENELQLVLGAEGETPSGQLYYNVTWQLHRRLGLEGLPALETHPRSIVVKREYRLLGGGESAGPVQRGDLVQVQLTLDVPQEAWYVVVNDPLPAGFEALNERLGTTSHVATTYGAPDTYWEQYGYNRKEVRDERVSFFVRYLAPGEHTLTYLVRATAEGTFTALPAQVYPMYEPAVWSRSSSSRHRVTPNSE
ncbi:MAG: hypothetical protein PVH11_05330 [Anaerolineae bacterium]|jgi:hypothetical protein